MPLYDLTANVDAMAILTPKVMGLGEPRRAAEQTTAEGLLELRSPIYTDAADVGRITLAIAHQMNFQVHQGIDPLFMSAAASTHAKQSDVYRDRYLSPIAKALVAAVAVQYPVDRFPGILTSLRSRGGTG